MQRLCVLVFGALLLAMLAASVLLDFRPASGRAVRWHEHVELAVVPLGEQHVRLGRHLPESALLEFSDVALEPPQRGEWREVDLPDLRPRAALLGESRVHAVSQRWYRLELAGGEVLYVPRVVGGPLAVWARPAGVDSGRWVPLMDNRVDWLTQWNRPLLVSSPRDPSVERWELALGMPAIEGVPFALARMATGQRADLEPIADRRFFWQLDGPRFVSLAGLMLGALALAFVWRGQQRRAHLLFAGIACVWSLRNLHFFIVPPVDALAYEWFWWMTNVSVNWLTLLLHLFVLGFLPQRMPKLERALVLYCALVTLLTIPLWPLRAEALLLQHSATVLVALGVGTFIAWRAWRSGDADSRLLAFVLLAGTIMAAHDLLLLGGRLPPAHVYLLPYACLALTLAFQHVLARQHGRTFVALQRAHDEQQRQLAAQHAELERTHRAALAAQLESTRLRERQQLMRDVHDGLGSSLLSALALLQQGRLQQPELSQLVSECIDDLRLVIDSLEPIEDDLATLLGTLRLRLAPRLQAAGVALEWSVSDELPPLAWLDPPAALQVLRIVQELIGNALRHARATRLTLSLRYQGDALEVDLVDDGCGFDVESPPRAGRGLSNLRARAATLRARLRIDSAKGRGTRAVLSLPLQR